MLPVEIDLSLPATATAPRQARHSLKSRLQDVLEAPVLDSLLLVVSELVTNSVRHARLRPEDVIGLRLIASPEAIRLDVSDPGGGFSPSPADLTVLERDGGWGLFLVDAIATRWGVVRDTYTHVWLEIERDSHRPAAGAPQAR